MYGTLKAELARKELTVPIIAKTLGVTEKTIRNKLEGITGFTFFETLKIRDEFFPEWNVEDLFGEADKKVG